MPVFEGDSGGMRRPHVRPVPVVPSSAFKGFRFPPEVIVVAVRWYLRFGLSYRDVEELLAERGIEVDHVTVFRCVQRFTPLLVNAARPCRHNVGDRWYVDETYVKASVDVTDLAMKVCGGAAFRRELGVERRFRDGRAARVMAPTTDALRDFIGQALTGL